MTKNSDPVKNSDVLNRDEKSRNRQTAEAVEKINEEYEDEESKGKGDGANASKINVKKEQKIEGGVQMEDGEDPTRYGDWTKNGRAIDF